MLLPIYRANRSERRAAFTLMEVLVVVAILVILAGAASIYVFGYLSDAKRDKAKLDIKSLTDAVKQYSAKNEGNFPQTLQELVQPTNGSSPIYDDPSILNDPWGKPYQYDPNGTRNNGLKPDIWTTTDKGMEIGNWPGGSDTNPQQ